MVWVHSINLRGSDSGAHTSPFSVLESSLYHTGSGNTRSVHFATSRGVTESPLCCVDGRWCPFHKYIEWNTQFTLTLWACLFIGRPSVRTANNPIEKLAGSPVLFSPLMNNSAVRVKAGRGDLVSDDWLSTLWPEGDTLNLTVASCFFITGSGATVCFLYWWHPQDGQSVKEKGGEGRGRFARQGSTQHQDPVKVLLDV